MEPLRDEDRRLMTDATEPDAHRPNRGMRTQGHVVQGITRWSTSKGSWKSANREGDPLRAGSQ